MKESLKNSNELYNWITDVIEPHDSLCELLNLTKKLGSDIPKVKHALVRADIDVPIADDQVTDSARLESLNNTLHLLWGNGIVPIIFGHVGRVPTNSAKPISEALSKRYDCNVALITEWFSDETFTKLSDEFIDSLNSKNKRSLILLENTRKYSFETLLWGKSPGMISNIDIDQLRVPAETLIQASQLFVSDSIASSNPDWSSLVLPFYADYSLLAQPVANEFEQFILPCTNSDVLIFSGLKADKLDDLERITASGLIQLIIVGGALALPFLVIKGNISEDQTHPLLNSKRVEQARAIMEKISNQGGIIALPLDGIDSNGRICGSISSHLDMLDIGPKTIETYNKILIDYAKKKSQVTIYMNGVFGKVEDELFQAGTVAMFELLRKVKTYNGKVYIGGGDGAAALRKFGNEKDVNHVFTAGGTVLKAMSGRPISYLSSLGKASL